MNPILPVDPAAAPMVDPMLAAMQAEAEAEARAKAIKDEEELVGQWEKRLNAGREHDKHARTQYAIDRRYVGGEAGRAGFDVSVNIGGTYTDVLVAFLYAKDPAVDAVPQESVGASRIEPARLLSKTMKIVVGKTWERARLKAAMRPQVRSGVSTGIGWINAEWYEDAGAPPVTPTRMPSIQDNAMRLANSQAELASGEAENPDALRASIAAQMEGLTAGVEQVRARGLVIDYFPPEDVQVAPECARLENYLEAPWIARRSFMTEAAAAQLATSLDKDQLAGAKLYTQIAPADPYAAERESASKLTAMAPTDADAFTTSDRGRSNGFNDGNAPRHVCVWAIRSRDDNMDYTWIEGTKRWARPPMPPRNPTTRFYSMFQWAPLQVDGQRHPQSLTSRAAPLLDEYDRIRSNKREHRKRAIPKLGFNRRSVTVEDATKMEGGGIGEMIGLDMLGEENPANVLFAIEYNRIDPALYDTSEVRSELEMLYGIQEALTSSIRTAKTLGEAEIQQSGTEAREGFKRDSLDEMLSELAVYTAEICLDEYTTEDVQGMAGPEAFWPKAEGQQLTAEDLAALVTVQIRAGSSGKPYTRLRQQQWAELLPLLREAIAEIARLRNSNPIDVANCVQELLIETLDRAGDSSLDPMRFLPPPGQPVMLMDPTTGQPVLAFLAPADQQPKIPNPDAPGAPPIADPAAAAAPAAPAGA